jgi:hypothetical protein
VLAERFDRRLISYPNAFVDDPCLPHRFAHPD